MSWEGARAYAAWLAAATGLPWRLPGEFEWEKAGRGADGRAFPWGEHFVPGYACTRECHPGRPLPAPVRAYPADESVYGVRGLSGGVRDWCEGRFHLSHAPPPADQAAQGERILRGGCWFFPRIGAHLAARFGLDQRNRGDTIGFRLARSLVVGDLM